ncbi:MAG: LysR family transcriptional regulator [Opitutales bacterium]|nr:LysR family transcriptional regulator [Opitutales bacterium]MCH8539296.1 LysR family transcriptional regulator [Opitutales bacterium]
MHIENLKVFCDLVESTSFSRAAKLNGVTQSAVSQQLRTMEKYFDATILDRSQKQFRLTAEGKILYETALQILQTFEKLHGDLQAMKKVVSGTIRIATVYSIGLHELPPYIKLFLQQFPQVNVRIEYRRSNLVYEDVAHNVVDLGLVAFPAKQRSIDILPWRDDELVFICEPNHPMAEKKSASLKEVAKQKFIGFEPDIPTRKEIDRIFREKNLPMDPVMEFDNIETVKRAVEIDAGVSIVPRSTVSQETQQGTLVSLPIEGPKLLRPLGILRRKGRTMTPALENFLSLLKRNVSTKTRQAGKK